MKQRLQEAGGANLWWKAFARRDGRFDGAVFIGVRTTGIYCRPSCPARRPRREHACFFERAEQAERAGFRPCRRCQPQRAGQPAPAVAIVLRACREMESWTEGTKKLAELSAQAGMSPFHFQRMFRRVTGVTPREYAEACRWRRFKTGVRGGEDVTEASYGAGFGSSSRLYERAAGQLGMTPGSYRRLGKGEQIEFATAACPLGRVLVATTERGICAVQLGDSDAQVQATLREEFPEAEIRRNPERLSRALRAVLQTMKTGVPHGALPLDIRATAFQWRVWKELQRIPTGETRSYSAIARAVGKPGAARAVARACARNRVAVLIPCHRVVREDGAVGGYRWGPERKQALLERERLAHGAATPSPRAGSPTGRS